MNKQEKKKRIAELEKEGKFNEHVVPPSFDRIKEVTPDYDYTRKGFLNQTGSFVMEGVFRFASVVIPPFFGLKIEGKENLDKVKSAVVTSNHINSLDCALTKKAFRHKKLKITVAEFNNPKGLFGSMLRAAGTLPLGKTVSSYKNLSKAIKEFLSDDQFVLFYPEVACWHEYEKPRPLASGAYVFSVENSVPLIPMFYTFKKRKHSENYDYVLHIGSPVFPDESLPKKQRIEKLRQQNFEFNRSVYESFYEKSLDNQPIS